MKIILLILASIFLPLDRTDVDTAALSRADLLTNGSQKSWALYSVVPEGQCGSTTDNSWIFFTNGTFEFDHGATTDDEVNGCGDFVNIIGTWQLSDSETHLKVVASHEKGNSSNVLDFTMLDGDIQELSEEKLVVIYRHPDTNSPYTFEFQTY